MSDKKIKRKIAVIFATDVVGYSKHMEADESETILNLRECEALLLGLFEKHEGRLFNTGGDSFLAEFPSAVSAVECAVEFQNAIQERNSKDDASVKLEFRIGINSGDVVKEKDNLLGDGVNIAARLEALAQTGGITISKSVYDFVQGKTRFEFNDLGVQKVKQNEFHAFDLLVDPSQKRKIKKRKQINLLSFALICLIFTTVIGYFVVNSSFEQVDLSEVRNKKSLLIYPFETENDDGQRKTLATALTNQVTTTLKRYNELFVHDTSSVEYFLSKKTSTAELKDKYGVQYTLKSSLQSSGDRYRVNLNLTKLLTDEVIWSETFDFLNEDIFEIQDKISAAVSSQVIPGILFLNVAAEGIKNEFSPEVYLNRLEGRIEYEKYTPEGLQEYKRILEINRDLEPNNPYLDLDEAWFLMGALWVGTSTDYQKNVEEAYKLTLKVLEVNAEYPYAVSLAQIIERNYLGELTTACGRLEKMASISNDPSILASAASLARHCGQYDKALSIFRKVENIAPHFSLWFKRDFAWTYLINEFEKGGAEFSKAKSYIMEQISKNYSEPGQNEMWYIMLAYIALIEGDRNTAIENFNKQSEMDNPIEVNWVNNHPNILNENEKFKEHFFAQLKKLGVQL
jgi:class 3 adenylate cyclase/TolB-like protein